MGENITGQENNACDGHVLHYITMSATSVCISPQRLQMPLWWQSGLLHDASDIWQCSLTSEGWSSGGMSG
jgi:hypothetical protein